MAQASATIALAASPEEVWKLIGGFGSLPDWLPLIPKNEMSEGGRLRHLTTVGGDTIVERLEKFDHAKRSYSYSFVETPFPVTDYLATITVQEAATGKGARVIWSGEFTPRGISDQEASQFFRNIYEGGLQALAARFGVAASG